MYYSAVAQEACVESPNGPAVSVRLMSAQRASSIEAGATNTRVDAQHGQGPSCAAPLRLPRRYNEAKGRRDCFRNNYDRGAPCVPWGFRTNAWLRPDKRTPAQQFPLKLVGAK